MCCIDFFIFFIFASYFRACIPSLLSLYFSATPSIVSHASKAKTIVMLDLSAKISPLLVHCQACLLNKADDDSNSHTLNALWIAYPVRHLLRCSPRRIRWCRCRRRVRRRWLHVSVVCGQRARRLLSRRRSAEWSRSALGGRWWWLLECGDLKQQRRQWWRVQHDNVLFVSASKQSLTPPRVLARFLCLPVTMQLASRYTRRATCANKV